MAAEQEVDEEVCDEGHNRNKFQNSIKKSLIAHDVIMKDSGAQAPLSTDQRASSGEKNEEKLQLILQPTSPFKLANDQECDKTDNGLK